MSKHKSATSPRWISHRQVWQAELLCTPHLTPAEKLTALALTKRFTTHKGVWIDLGVIARETGQSVADVRAVLARGRDLMIFHIQKGRLVSKPKPDPLLRSWKRSPRREKRVRTIERELAEQLTQALAREAWRESREPKEHAV